MTHNAETSNNTFFKKIHGPFCSLCPPPFIDSIPQSSYYYFSTAKLIDYCTTRYLLKNNIKVAPNPPPNSAGIDVYQHFQHFFDNQKL